MTTHTPGPWFVARTGAIGCPEQPSGKCAVAMPFDVCDAALLAAAPELLAACIEALRLARLYGGWNPEDLTLLENIILKATKESDQ